MATWQEVTESAPEFARRVRELMDAHKHKTIATLRSDGAPRISGIEADFACGQLWFGSMSGARKARDLQRDPRFALHSASVVPNEDDPSSWPGDAKFSGRAIEVTDPGELRAYFQERGLNASDFGGAHFFKADITEVVLTRVNGDHLEIDLWRPAEGLRRFERK